MNFLTLKDKFYQKILNLQHFFDKCLLPVWVARLDCKMSLGSIISCMNATYVPKNCAFALVVNDFAIGIFWFIASLCHHG